MNQLSVDLVSDLHIDQWDEKLANFYPCGERKNFPINWFTTKNNILIVAGDVSDDLDKTIAYLDFVSMYYEYILFVDGNHEHVNKYPNMYTETEIKQKIKNPKIIYLPYNDFCYKDYVFIGYCGWWDCQKSTKIGDNKDYFHNWINTMDEEKTINFLKNCAKKSEEQYEKLIERIQHYNDKKIIIVTHTVPRAELSRDIPTDHNTFLTNIKSDNIVRWFFGHNHEMHFKRIDNTLFVSNPRGRPEDFDRIFYKPLSVKLG